jgi:hypothetical protein
MGGPVTDQMTSSVDSPLMGNHQVWSAKSVWDRFLYFAVFGILHHNGGLTDVAFMGTVAEDFGRVAALNHRMQAFFREWDDVDPGVDQAHFVDHTGNVGLITTFEEVLHEHLQPAALRARLKTNIEFIDDVMRVIMARAATRAGHHTDPVDVDPMTFVIGGLPPAVQLPAVGRENTIAQAAELLQGLWHDHALVGR